MNIKRKICRCQYCHSTNFSALGINDNKYIFECADCGETSKGFVQTEKTTFPVVHLYDKTIDSSKEFEISNNKFGFNAFIEFKSDSRYKNEVRLNCTEIHYMYPTYEEQRVAFESDIHGHGGTLPLTEIETIYIKDAVKIHKHY